MRKFLFVIALFLFNSTIVFAQFTTTPNIGLKVPVRGSNNWDIPLYYDWSLIDNMLGGTTPLPNGLQVNGPVVMPGFTITSSQIITGLGYTPLNVSNNLSDVSNAATALANLGGIGAYSYKGAWSNTFNYSMSAIVLYNGISYISLQPGNVNEEPNTSPTYWGPLTSIPTVSSVFDRTGAVTAQTGDYTAAQVTNAAAVNAANTFTQTNTFRGQVNVAIVNNVVDVSSSCATPGVYDQTCWSNAFAKAVSVFGNGNFKILSGPQTYTFTGPVTIPSGLSNIEVSGAGASTVITGNVATYTGGTPFAFSGVTKLWLHDISFIDPLAPIRVVIANGANNLPQSGYICIDRWGTGNCDVPTGNDGYIIPTASGGSCAGSSCLSASPQQWTIGTAGPNNTLQIMVLNSSQVRITHIYGTYAEITAQGVDDFTVADSNMTGGAQINNWGTIAVIPPSSSLAISSVSSTVSGAATYTGTITNGASNALAGKWFSITGDPTDLLNNGIFYCSASTSTTLTLLNPHAVSDTVAMTAQQLNTNIVIRNNVITNSSFSGVSVRASANVLYAHNHSSFEGESGFKIGQDAGNYVFHLRSENNITNNNTFDGLDYQEQYVETSDSIDCGGCSSNGDISYFNGDTGLVTNGLHWSYQGLSVHDNGTPGALFRISDSVISGVEAWHNNLSGNSSVNQVDLDWLGAGTPVLEASNIHVSLMGEPGDGIYITNGNSTILSNSVVDDGIIQDALGVGHTQMLLDSDTTGRINNVIGSDGNVHTLAQIASGATGLNANIVPDSSVLLGWTYWSNAGAGAAWSITTIPETGTNGFAVSSATSGVSTYSADATFNLVAGASYTFSSYIDASNVSSGTLAGSLFYTSGGSQQYISIFQSSGAKGRVYNSFTMPIPSGDSAGQLVPTGLLFNTSGAIFTGNVYFAAPMVQAGTVFTSYQSNLMSNASTTFMVPILNAINGYQVNGTALAASNLSNGTTGTGAVVLGSSPTIDSPTLTTHIVNSVALQHFSATLCVVGSTQYSVCTTTATLPVAEPDTNYSATCSLYKGNAGIVLQTYNKTTTTIGFQVTNLWTQTPASSMADCIVTHN